MEEIFFSLYEKLLSVPEPPARLGSRGSFLMREVSADSICCSFLNGSNITGE